MKKAAHIAISTRAVALLDADEDTRPLAALLRPCLPLASVGAWLPDEKFFKSGHGDTQNHVLKMAEYNGPNAERFIVSHKETLKQLGDYSRLYNILKDPGRLPAGWWERPYRGDCPRGEHPASCAMSLATMLIDLLLLGDPQLQQSVPKAVSSRIDLPAGALTRGVQIALYFFMLSHYLADVHMPCHTDARPLAKYSGKLHAQWEQHIDKRIAAFPSPDQVSAHTPEALIERAVAAIPFELPRPIPALKEDVWTEVIRISRASFAVSCIIASPDRYPLVKTAKPRTDELDLPAEAPMPSFHELFDDRPALLAEVTDAILHDSVLSVARVWKHVWQTVTRRSAA